MGYYSFIDPGRMKGWVGLVSWPIADSLPAKWSPVQLLVRRRTGKVRQRSISFLPLCYVEWKSLNSTQSLVRWNCWHQVVVAARRTARLRADHWDLLRCRAAMSSEQELARDCHRRQRDIVHDERLQTGERLHVQNSSEQWVRHQRPVAQCHGLF